MDNIQNIVHFQMLRRIWSNGNTHSLLVGMQNGTAAFEDSLTVSYKAKHTVEPTIQQLCSW